MTTPISNLRTILLTLFAVTSVGMIAYEWWFVWPAKKCDEKQLWWDARDHQCLTPMPIWKITGHLPAAVKPAPTPVKP